MGWRAVQLGDADVVIAKVFSLGMRLPSFMERFPDARVLYMVRDPLSTISRPESGLCWTSCTICAIRHPA